MQRELVRRQEHQLQGKPEKQRLNRTDQATYKPEGRRVLEVDKVEGQPSDHRESQVGKKTPKKIGSKKVG